MKPDPKPNLSRAAMEANIEYYRAQEERAGLLYRDALFEHTYWLRELAKLKRDTDEQ